MVVCVAATGAETAPVTSPAGASTQPACSPVKRGSLSVVIDSVGYLDAIDPFEVRVRPKTYSGDLTIAHIAANGVAVKKGDVLLQVDPSMLSKQLAAAQNEAAAASANLEKARADAKLAETADNLAMKIQQAALQQAEDGVKWWDKVDGPQMLLGADLAVKQAQYGVDDGQDELDQLKKMYKSEELTNATADIVVRRAVRGLELAKTQLSMQRDRADKIKTFEYSVNRQRILDGLEQARQGFAQFQVSQAHGKALRATGLVTASAASASADERVADLKADAEKLSVTAPFDGVACYGQLVRGAWQGGDEHALRASEKIQPQQVLLTVFAPGKLRAVVEVPEPMFFQIKPGTSALVTPVALPGITFSATSDAAAPEAQAGPNGPVYPVALSTGGVDSRLVPGMKVNVHIDSSIAQNVLVIPLSAVAGSTVQVRSQDGTDEPHVIVLGRSDGTMVEVVSGVSEGQQVLTKAKK